ncbi:hypothetical protein EMCRGX_G012263 [Ephydatia muelleri]
MSLFPTSIPSSNVPNVELLGVPIARGTPSSSAVEALKDFDLAVANCFTKCTGLDISVDAWKQAQLSPRRGGLGLRPLSLHTPATYISSLCSSDSAIPSHPHLTSTIILFNNCVPPPEAVSVHSLLSNPPSQRHLSEEDSQFASLYNSMSCANKARLLSVSSPHASACPF